MAKRRLKIEILSFWHPGTGEGLGPVLDACVRRDSEGLPYLPGRTVKGLLKDAVLDCVECGGHTGVSKTDAAEVFGIEAGLAPVGTNTEGRLHVTNAVLEADLRSWFRCQEATAKDGLFKTMSSTALVGGVAKDKSLRVIELAIPLKLEAELESEKEQDFDLLRHAIPMFRKLGSHRHRGLGRCVVKIDKEGGR